MHGLEGFEVLHNELHPVIALINFGPEHDAAIGDEVVLQSLEGFTKHYRLGTAGEIFESEDRHASSFFGGDRFNTRNHHHAANIGLTMMVTDLAQGDRREEAGFGLNSFERMIRHIQAE